MINNFENVNARLELIEELKSYISGVQNLMALSNENQIKLIKTHLEKLEKEYKENMKSLERV